MRFETAKRRGKGARRLPVSEFRELFRDGRVWCALGKVFAPDGGEHWYVDESKGKRRVMVEVETLPDGQDLTCRLGTCASGPSTGVWFVPSVGALVLVAIPSGETDHCPVIVAVLDSGSAPDRVSPGRVIIVSDKPIEVTAPKVYLGPNPDLIVEATDGLVHGLGVDPFTGKTYSVLQGTTTKVFAKKV